MKAFINKIQIMLVVVLALFISSVYSQTCKICECCKDGYCDSNNHCPYGCIDGYYGTYCTTDCPENCITCTVQSSGIQCGACVDGYAGNRCNTKCSPNCVSCSKYNHERCFSCVDGYYIGKYLDSSQFYTNYTCSYSCHSSCASCSTYKTCTTCAPGRFKSGSSEKCDGHCSTGCKTCSTFSQCSECMTGYTLDGNWCLECPRNCLTCFTNGACQTCNDGFFVDGTICIPCSSNCKTCTDSNTCAICQEGYELDDNTCVVKCSNGCKSCVVPTECSICNDGFLLKDGVCEEVICYGNSYLDISECKPCPLNCTSCDSMEVCTKCDHGLKGVTCNETCNNCRSQTRCDKEDGYCYDGCADGLFGTYCNQTCRSNCETCLRNDGFCVTCANGYHGYNCLCTLECSYCDNFGVCQLCNTGYFETSLGCRCRKDVCENSECTSCKNTTSYAHQGHCCQCNAKVENCLECSNINRIVECTKCDNGFYPKTDPASTCERCPANCINGDCDSTTGRCTYGCENGYWGDKCELKCIEHCVACHQDNGGCLECDAGRYGENCTGKCSKNCRNTTMGQKLCQMNGSCVNGCDAGFHGKTCSQECNNTCMVVHGNRCYDTNGTCISGCIDGYHGIFCGKECNENCVNRTCDSKTGTCSCKEGFAGTLCSKVNKKENQSGVSETIIGGAVGGAAGFLLILAVLIIIIVVVFRKRRQQKDNESAIDVNRNSLAEHDGGHHVYYNTREALNDEITVQGAVYEEIPDGPSAMKNELKSEKATVKVSLETDTSKFNELKTFTDNGKNAGKDNLNQSMKVDSINEERSVNKEVKKKSADKKLKVEPMVNDKLEELPESNVQMDMSHTQLIDSEEIDDTYYNEGIIKKNKISVKDLATYVSKKTMDEFIYEFEELPQGLVKPYLVSQYAENMSKNRYKGVYPYDATRVVLQSDESDYINANFIDGYKKRKAYIASMGPTFKYMKVMTPFWQMILENKVDKIVMLTKLDEAGVPKCDMYWPHLHTTDTHGDISVTSKKENTCAEYVIRTFKVEKDSESMTVLQYHFTAWPDKKTPDDVSSLVSFWHTVNSGYTSNGGPIVVHCSAGVGRTGTYIALDALTEEGTLEHNVDIFSYVVNLRYQRVNMVQTWEQYHYLHQALVYTLTFNTKPVDVSNFTQYMSTQTDKDLAVTFQKLSTCPCIQSDTDNEAKKKNKTFKDKNRPGADIPGDTHRPFLHLGRMLGTSDYINAIYVNSFKDKNRYIVAQSPLQSTIEDFLLLVYQEQCLCIVDCDSQDIGENTPKLTTDQIREFGDFTIDIKTNKDHSTYVQRSLTLSYKSKDINVTWLKYNGWKENETCPTNVHGYLNFVEHVSEITNERPDKPILIHCRDAATRSGLFCVVSTILEKISRDQEVSIINIICQFRSRRAIAIPNKEQYIFCHRIVEEYLQTGDVYSNLC